jgi:hypothetical protein
MPELEGLFEDGSWITLFALMEEKRIDVPDV